MKRRRFVKTASSAALGLIAARAPLFAKGSPSEKVVVCVMGLNGRGTVLAKTFAKTANAEVAAVCDVDSTVLAKAATTFGVKGIADFRRALDDKSIDALVIAAPDHWHAPAAILAMSAGKHVYVEKPLTYSVHEARVLRETAVGTPSSVARARILAVPGEPLFYADWLRAVFIHYEVDADALQRDVPFDLDLHDGSAYVSLVDFTLRNMRPRLGGKLTAS